MDLFFGAEAISWDDTSIGESNLTSNIQISTSSEIINGSTYNIPVRVYDDYTFEQIANFQLTIGEVSVSDPFGPDSYGYYIYGEEKYAFLGAASLLPEIGKNNVESYFSGNKNVNP